MTLMSGSIALAVTYHSLDINRQISYIGFKILIRVFNVSYFSVSSLSSKYFPQLKVKKLRNSVLRPT
jgi:hypothetical protein